MDRYIITTDPTEIISGTDNKTSPAYTEAAKITRGDDLQRSIAYLQSFANSIEKVAKLKGSRDPLLVRTGGNIQNLQGFKTMSDALGYLGTHLKGNSDLASLKTIMEYLQRYQSLYTDGYKHKVTLVMFEYEAVATMLIRGISVLVATAIEVKSSPDGKISIEKANKVSGGIISKISREMAVELQKKEHENYLRELIKLATDPERKPGGATPVGESAEDFTESSLEAGVKLFDTIIEGLRYAKKGATGLWRLGVVIVKSAFGIVPLIRSAFYLYYKRKADTVANLETQAQFVEMNIEQLKNIKNMDGTKKAEIIKKQEAVVTAYRKRAEKLRAQLIEEEKDGKAALDDDNSNIDGNGDFVLD